MAIALFASYFTVMAAKCALPSTLSILTSDHSGLSTTTMTNLLTRNTNLPTPITPNQLMAATLSISTLSITLGKTLLGPLIDAHSGTTCLRTALTLLALALAVIATTTHFHVFALAWIAVDFLFSSCWAASLNAVHWGFGERYWADMIGVLAVAARAGNAVSFLGFAWVLGVGRGIAGAGANVNVNGVIGAGGGGREAWRMVFWVSAGIQAIPLLLLGMFGNKTIANDSDGNTEEGLVKYGSSTATTNNNNNNNNNNTSKNTSSFRISLLILRREARTPAFWTHLISRSALMPVASFLLFVPSYMSTAYAMTPSTATRVGSVYALGCLIPVSLASRRFSNLPTGGRIAATIGMLGALAICCLSQMAHVVGGGAGVMGSKMAGTVVMFVWGLTFSIPFYVPPSLYALRRGGRQSSATIADAFDLGGYTLLAMFTGFVVNRQQQDIMAWYLPFKLLLVCIVVSMISLPIALSLDDRSN